MPDISQLGSWIAENESLLSGVAAIIVVGGVVVSALSMGLRRLSKRGADGAKPSASAKASVSSEPGASEPRAEERTETPGPHATETLTLKKLTAPSPHETKFARSSGVRVAYNERGEGPPHIVMAPGIISHLNITEHLPGFQGTLAGLERFAHVVTFDKRGQGLSDPTMSTPNLEERTDDIEAVMDDSGLERAVLLGFSEGGPMCLHYAYTHPDRVQGLILVGSTARWLQSDDFPIGIPRNALEGLPKAWGTGVLRDLFFPGMSREQMDDATYKAFENLVATRTSIRQIVDMITETDVRALLPEIRIPTLVIHFAGDLAVPIRLGRFLAEEIPGAEFLEVNAVDHADLSQAPEAMERIEAFCRGVAD